MFCNRKRIVAILFYTLAGSDGIKEGKHKGMESYRGIKGESRLASEKEYLGRFPKVKKWIV